MSPKRLARLARFERVHHRLRGTAYTWSGLAAELGFADQAHLVREIRHFSGLTPTALSQELAVPVPATPMTNRG